MAYTSPLASIIPVTPDDAEAQLRAMLGLGPNDPLPVAAPMAPTDDQSQQGNNAAPPVVGGPVVTTSKDDSSSKNDDLESALISGSQNGATPPVVGGPITSPDDLESALIANPSAPSTAAAINPKIAAPGASAPAQGAGLSPDVLAAQNKLATVRAQGSGVSHHGGFLKALDIAGSILAPGVMAAIPGTTLNYAAKVRGAQNQVNQAMDTQAKTMQIQDTAAQAAERQASVNAVKPVGTPIETSSGIYQVFTDKQGNPTTVKLDIPAGKSQDYELKETTDPVTGKPVYASVNKTNPSDVKYTNIAVPTKDTGAIDSPDKALGALNKAHNALADAIKGGDPDTIQKAQADFDRANNDYQNFVKSDTALAGKKSAAEAAGRFPEQQANRNAQIQSELGKQGASDAIKADQAYQDTVRQATNLKQTIAAAQNKDALAASLAPLEGALFVTTANGIKRINTTEVHGLQMAGSLKDRIEGWINGKISGDSIPSDIKQGFLQMADQYQKNAYNNYVNKISSVNSRTGSKLDPVGYDGTVGGAGLPAPQQGNGVPAGASHVYRDPKTQQIVGYALNGQYHPLGQ